MIQEALRPMHRLRRLYVKATNSVLTSFRLKGSAKIRYLCNRNGQPQSNRICSINRLVVVCSKLSSKPNNCDTLCYSIRSYLPLTNSLSLAHWMFSSTALTVVHISTHTHTNVTHTLYYWPYSFGSRSHDRSLYNCLTLSPYESSQVMSLDHEVTTNCMTGQVRMNHHQGKSDWFISVTILTTGHSLTCQHRYERYNRLSVIRLTMYLTDDDHSLIWYSHRNNSLGHDWPISY